MRLFLILIAFGFSFNVYAVDSKMNFTTKELGENELIAASRMDIATAIRVIQLQLKASGCSRPIVDSPNMFEKVSDYTFNLSSENCLVVPKSSKCESGYSPRNMKANPNSSTDAIVGADKYIVCLKDFSTKSQSSGAK